MVEATCDEPVDHPNPDPDSLVIHATLQLFRGVECVRDRSVGLPLSLNERVDPMDDGNRPDRTDDDVFVSGLVIAILAVHGSTVTPRAGSARQDD